MDESQAPPHSVASEASKRALPRFGEAIGDIERRFGPDGILGLVLIDASGLAGIERSYGYRALRLAMNNLGALVGEIVGDRLSINDMLVFGETGRAEILVLLFREPGEAELYERELPGLSRTLRDGIASRGHRLAYPYLKQAPTVTIGVSATLRNPTLDAETQVRSVLEDARRDSKLNSRLEDRRRRRNLFDVLVNRRVRAVFEPIVDVASRTVFGYEALSRGPEGTDLYSAQALFGTAEEQDLMFQLDCLCRQMALKGAREFPAGCKLFLNVRPTTIHDPNFREELLGRTLAECGLQPSDVVFEISEQESIGNFEIFREVRDYYRKLGFQIALDDTGAGYASLEAVMELSPEFIKIDGAFIRGIDQDPARQQLVSALRTVADQINAQMIGEGLDTLEELEMLGTLGIRFGQGWLFGKPAPLRHDV
jgi:EAL domain-containing protein (putative c-di-GMP-specific phosphodiesterase class I)